MIIIVDQIIDLHRARAQNSAQDQLYTRAHAQCAPANPRKIQYACCLSRKEHRASYMLRAAGFGVAGDVSDASALLKLVILPLNTHARKDGGLLHTMYVILFY